VSAFEVWAEINIVRPHRSAPTTMHVCIDVLIDRFVRDLLLRVVNAESSGDLLGRESFHELVVHICPYRLIFETVFSSTVTAIRKCSLVCQAWGVPQALWRVIPPDLS
jgi:hypothetical protein